MLWVFASLRFGETTMVSQNGNNLPLLPYDLSNCSNFLQNSKKGEMIKSLRVNKQELLMLHSQVVLSSDVS